MSLRVTIAEGLNTLGFLGRERNRWSGFARFLGCFGRQLQLRLAYFYSITKPNPGIESYTLSFWFKPDSTGSTQALFAKGTEVSTTNTEGFLAYLKSGDAVVRAADGNNVAHAFAPSISTDWHHFAAVRESNAINRKVVSLPPVTVISPLSVQTA